MTGLAVSVILHAAMATGAQSYSEAYSALIEEGRPMLVVVGADWCPACQTMKNGTLAQMERQGKLREISYVALNSDRQPDLAARIGQGSMIPQVILYEKTEKGFRRRHLAGAQGEGTILSLVKGAVQRRTALGKVFRQTSN
jgi:thioredoxin-like negative regulator of GroEL